MKKSLSIFATILVATATIACGSEQADTDTATLRIFSPIAMPSGVMTRVEYRSSESAAFEVLEKISIRDIGGVEVNDGVIQGLSVELGESGNNVPVFATTVYFDGAMAAQPVDLSVPVPADAQVKLRMQLVTESQERLYPKVYEKVLTAQQVERQEQPIVTVR